MTKKKTYQERNDDAIVNAIIKEARREIREKPKTYKPIKWTTNNYKASIINDFLGLKNAR